MLDWGDLGNQIRYEMIRQRNPGASESELIALWTEETHRHTLAPAFLAKALAAIRARGAAETPAVPKRPLFEALRDPSIRLFSNEEVEDMFRRTDNMGRPTPDLDDWR